MDVQVGGMSPRGADVPVHPDVVAQVEAWLRQHLPSLLTQAELAILCAGQELRLDLIASPLQPERSAELLVDHLVRQRLLLPFAAGILADDKAGPPAREQGLGALLDRQPPRDRVRPPLYCHQLLRVAAFSGRTQELATLDWAWQEGARVLALTGAAGAGKSTLLQHWLEGRGLSDPRRWKDFGLEGLFLWSFAVSPDVSDFLRAAADYVEGVGGAFSPVPGAPGPRRTLTEEESQRRDLRRLLTALERTSGHVLLVLDGLERFQASSLDAEAMPLAAGVPAAEPAGPKERPFDLHEPALRELLVELAAVDGEAALLCTLEQEVPSLLPWRGSGYVPVPVPPLPPEDAARLLRQCGVTRGSDKDAEQRGIEHLGNALCLDLFARYVSAYYHGDARAVTVTDLPSFRDIRPLPEAPTLGRVLQAQVQALSDPQRGLLELCVLLPSQTSLSSLLLLSQVAREHTPLAGPLAVETVLSPLRDLDAAELRARLFDLGRLGLLQFNTGMAAGAADEQVLIDMHPALRRILYKSWLDVRGGRAVQPGRSSRDSDALPRPQDSAVLDLLEQLVLVALEAGLISEAYELLATRMGGYPHLGRTLGEYRRLLGILRILSPVLLTVAEGDPAWARRGARVLSWEAETLRDLGQLAGVLEIAEKERVGGTEPIPGALAWQVEVHLLAGRLDRAQDSAKRALFVSQSVAARVLAAVEQARVLLLCGETALARVYLRQADLLLKEEPQAVCEWDGLSLREVLDRERLELALRLSDLKQAMRLLPGCQELALREGRGKDQAYLDVLAGEVARRRRDPLDAAQFVHRALAWGARTGDAEVLVRAGLCHARIRMDTGNLDGAASALGMALPAAAELGLVLDRIDLQLLRGHLLLRRGDLPAAEDDARDALAYATAPGCGYLWGEADALHLLALVLLSGRPAGARVLEAATHLSDEIELRERMSDPRASDSRWLLRRLTA